MSGFDAQEFEQSLLDDLISHVFTLLKPLLQVRQSFLQLLDLLLSVLLFQLKHGVELRTEVLNERLSLITVGKATKPAWPKPGQLPLSEVVIENSF